MEAINTILTKIIVIVLVGMIPTVTFAQAYSGDSWKKVQSEKKGTISVAYVETPSFVYAQDGATTGICVDIMNDFKEWLKTNKGAEVELAFVGDGSSFKGMYEKVRGATGGVFGLGNITITPERKKEVRFSQPIITNFAILITQTSAPNLAKLEDMAKTFSGMTAYTAKGTLNEKRMLELKQKYFPNLKISYTTTSQESLEKVFADPMGMAYLDLAFYLEAVQLKKNIKRHAVADKATEQFGIIMPMNSDWSPVMDEFMKAGGGYTNSSRYKSILVKHLGEAGMKLMQSAGK